MLNFIDILRIGLLSVLIFQVFVIAFQLLINQRREALYYLLYIVFVFLYNVRLILSTNQSGFSDDWLLYMDKPVVAMIFWSYFRFARYFLEVPKLDATFNRIARIFEFSLLICCLILCVMIYFFGESKALDIAFFLFSIYATISSVLHLAHFVRIRKTSLNGFIVTGAFLILLGSTTTFILYEWHKIEPIFYFDNLTIPHLIATFLELVVFSSGITLKSYIIEKEKRETDRILLHQMRENESISQELSNVKSSISADLHDDIGATFNSIDIYSTVTEKALLSGDLPLAVEYQKKIRSLAADSISDMRDTIWLLKQNEKTNLTHLVERWLDKAKPLLDAKGIVLKSSTEQLSDRFLSLNTKRHLYYSLKEILNNVVKHSGSSTLEIKCFHKDEKDWIEITDYGTGFEIEQTVIGEGLKNIRERMKLTDGMMKITSRLGEGTKILIGI